MQRKITISFIARLVALAALVVPLAVLGTSTAASAGEVWDFVIVP